MRGIYNLKYYIRNKKITEYDVSRTFTLQASNLISAVKYLSIHMADQWFVAVWLS